VKRGVKRGGRRVTGSLLARRGQSGSAQFITWPRVSSHRGTAEATRLWSEQRRLPRGTAFR
jgi:hypothetical protein